MISKWQEWEATEYISVHPKDFPNTIHLLNPQAQIYLVPSYECKIVPSY